MNNLVKKFVYWVCRFIISNISLYGYLNKLWISDDFNYFLIKMSRLSNIFYYVCIYVLMMILINFFFYDNVIFYLLLLIGCMYMFWYYRDDEIEVESIRLVRNNLCDLMNVFRLVLKKVFFIVLRN